MTATQILETIVSAIKDFSEGLAEAMVGFFKTVFVSTGALTELGTFILVLMGIGVTYFIVRWVRSLIRV